MAVRLTLPCRRTLVTTAIIILNISTRTVTRIVALPRNHPPAAELLSPLPRRTRISTISPEKRPRRPDDAPCLTLPPHPHRLRRCDHPRLPRRQPRNRRRRPPPWPRAPFLIRSIFSPPPLAPRPPPCPRPIRWTCWLKIWRLPRGPPHSLPKTPFRRRNNNNSRLHHISHNHNNNPLPSFSNIHLRLINRPLTLRNPRPFPLTCSISNHPLTLIILRFLAGRPTDRLTALYRLRCSPFIPNIPHRRLTINTCNIPRLFLHPPRSMALPPGLRLGSSQWWRVLLLRVRSSAPTPRIHRDPLLDIPRTPRALPGLRRHPA